MNSKIILAEGIHLDQKHINVLSYDETNMLYLMEEHKLYEGNDFSIIKESENRISLPCSYAIALRSNYIAFQNPDYSNKWFFAWREQVIYKSENTVEITFKIDNWATWFDNWTALNCYVVREHTTDDSIGANIIQEDFSVSLEDMKLVNNEMLFNTGTPVYCVAVNKMYDGYINPDYADGRVYGGVPVGYATFAFATSEAMQQFLANYAEEPDKVVGVYLVRSEYLVKQAAGQLYDVINNSGTGQINALIDDNGQIANKSYTPTSGSIDGYTPKNNKLFTYPYRYIKLCNGLGGAGIFAIERFNGNPAFDVVMNKAMQGGYLVYASNYAKGASVAAPKENNISSNGQVTGSWQADGLGQWIANNGVSTAVSAIGGLAASGVAVAAGVATANPIAVAGGVISAASTIGNLSQQINKVEHLANPIVGNCNSLGLLHTADSIDPMIEEYALRSPIARIIDDYFTKYGYATKRLKVPNIKTRDYYNYIQVQGAIAAGTLPAEAAEEINEICNRGVHIWHNHSVIGDFSVTNNIKNWYRE